MIIVIIHNIKFTGKRSFPWKDVENYMARYSGQNVIVKETGDSIIISSRSISEFCGSVYTKKLHVTMAKAKGNVSQVLIELIENATNRRWVENKDEKHANDAKGGWYRYDVFFSLPIEFAGKNTENYYIATLVARLNDLGIYFHDIINIKKEDSKPFESEDRTV